MIGLKKIKGNIFTVKVHEIVRITIVIDIKIIAAQKYNSIVETYLKSILSPLSIGPPTKCSNSFVKVAPFPPAAGAVAHNLHFPS